MNNAVKYKDLWFARNSQAYSLYEAKEFVKLDKLIAEVNATYKRMTYGS